MWSEYEDKVLEDNIAKGLDIVCELLPNRTYNSIKTRASLKGYSQREYWSDSDIQIIKDNYLVLSRKELQELLPGRTIKSITHMAHKLDIFKEKHETYDAYRNQEFFSNIDTSEKAYVLGFWVSDGYMYPKRNIIGFVSKDLEQLEMIAKLMKCKSPNIKKRVKKGEGIIYDGEYTVYELTISSKQMINDLTKLGYNNKKSYEAVYPNIPAELDRYFIAGNFDGDGCITRYKNRQEKYVVQIQFLGTKQLIEEIKKRLPTDVNMNFVKNHLWKLQTSADKASNILKWMYSDSVLHLERKYQRYLDSLTQTGFYLESEIEAENL